MCALSTGYVARKPDQPMQTVSYARDSTSKTLWNVMSRPNDPSSGSSRFSSCRVLLGKRGRKLSIDRVRQSTGVLRW